MAKQKDFKTSHTIEYKMPKLMGGGDSWVGKVFVLQVWGPELSLLGLPSLPNEKVMWSSAFVTQAPRRWRRCGPLGLTVQPV